MFHDKSVLKPTEHSVGMKIEKNLRNPNNINNSLIEQKL